MASLDKVEKRSKRRFGVKEWGTWRIPVVNKKIRVDHEVKIDGSALL